MSASEYSRLRAGEVKEAERLESQGRLFAVVRRQAELLNIKGGTKVLDAGCGTGSFARQVSPLVLPEQISAVDLDPFFVDEARRLAGAEGRTNIAFRVGDVEALDFAEGETYDLVYCRFLLPHLENPSRAISELRRVTKKGGVVASSDEGDLFTHPPIDEFFGLFAKVAQWREATQGGQSGATREPSLYELFAAGGLRNLRTFPIPLFASSAENPEKLRRLSLVALQMLETYKDEVISGGFMTETEYRRGLENLDDWLGRPDAFWMVLSVLTVGTA